jgi:hypothetical protein
MDLDSFGSTTVLGFSLVLISPETALEYVRLG